MKNKLKQSQQKKLAYVKSRESLQHLKHILSPLEEAALKHNYKPFVYDYNGIPLYISHTTSRQLIFYITHKITFLTSIIEKERLSRKIPLKHREAFDDPRLIMALPPRLRNQLYRLRCYTLFTIMQKGRSYFTNEEKFSSLAMQRLDALFAKHKCAGVFK